jgi:hypothetical protein
MRDVLHRWVNPLEADSGQEFELFPPAAVSGGDATAAALNGVAAFLCADTPASAKARISISQARISVISVDQR